MEGSGHTILTFERDHHEVCQSLTNLRRRNDLIVLGTALGLSYPTLLGMGSSDDFLNQIVAAWLKRQDNVLSQSGEPTWSILADKLEEIGYMEIAADIRRRNDGPQHESEQRDGDPPTLATDSLMDDHQSHASLSGLSCAPYSLDQTMVPISNQSVTQSKQDEPHTRACLEEPLAPKRTKLDQQSIREQSSNQQLSCTTSTVPATYKYAMGKMFSARVTVTPVVARTFRHHTASQAQPTGRDSLQNAVVASSFPPPPTCSVTVATTSTTTSTTPLTTPHQATSLALARPDSTVALPNTGDPTLTESIRAEEAGEAFREHRAGLQIAVTDPLILASSLYSTRIISREILDRVKLLILTPTVKKMELFDAVEARIQTNPSDFGTLCDILRSDPQLCVFAERLEQSYQLKCASKGALEPTNLTAMMQLNRYLMDIYKSVQQSCDTKFPHLPEKAFITLAVIEKEFVSRANADVFTKGTLHGHADEILKQKKPIAIETVLEPPEGQQNMKCIFVEGAPGIGKSTFALEFCRIQEKLKIYSLVVLLRLREKHVQGIKSTNDLFYQNTDLQQAVTKEVVACSGKNVLFVLDGFDELPTELRKNSFIVELIQGKHLPECTILVTSRPSATADLHFSCKPQIHKHIEILGFTHEHIQQYAESMLSDQPDVLEDFLKYISNNPAIHGMMYIPLNSAIVLEIYKATRTTGRPVPCTMTQLYTELCLVLLRKYLVENRDPLADNLQGRLENIPDALREKVLKLGKLALEGALRQQITFEQLPEGVVDLGFMNVSTGLYLGRKSVVSYSFLHLTLQEFLAAFYVSQLSGVEQKLLFIETLNLLITDMFLTNTYSSHLDVLWRFMAGLTGFKDIGWKLVHKAIQSKLFRRHHNLLLVHCLLEIQEEQMIKTACDIIIKERETTQIRIQPGQSDTFVAHANTPFDCYAVGYCVAMSGYEWSLNLKHAGGNEIIEMLGCGIRSIGDVCGYFGSLNLAENSLTYQAIASLKEFPSKILSQIHKLDLSSNQLNKDAFDCLAGILSHMVNLTRLDVSCNPGNPGGMVKLFQELFNTKVVELNVCETNLGPSDIQALPQLIRHNGSLKNLKIGDKDMSPECVALIVQTLLSPSSLEELELWWISYTPDNAQMWKLLENNTNLTSLKLLNTFIGVNLALPYIAKALHMNGSLKILRLSVKINLTQADKPNIHDFMYHIGTDSVKALSEMLKVNNTLTLLEILTDNLTQDDIITLSNALQGNKTLEYLRLHRQAIAKAFIIDRRMLY